MPVLIPNSKADCMHPVPCSHPHLLYPHVDSHHSYRYSGLHPNSIHVPVTLWFQSLEVVLWFHCISPVWLSWVFPLLNIALRTLCFYPAHSMRSPTLGCLLETLFIHFWLIHPLVTFCILVLDLVFSVEGTSVWACSLSWQPYLRAFWWWSFMMSILYQFQPICTLVRLETHS